MAEPTNIAEIFGKPHEGVHSSRVFTSVIDGGIASVDLLMTGVAAIAIGAVMPTAITNGSRFRGTVIAFVILMCLAIVLHYLFRVPTALNIALGLFSPHV